MTTDDPVPLGQSLDAVLRSVRGPSKAAVGGVFGRWDEIVGASIAEHVRPAQLDQEVLLVEVDDPAWATQMKFLSAQIISQIDDVVGVKITRIDVKVDRRHARGQRGV